MGTCFPVGASLLAMDVNDNARCLNDRVVQTFFASKLRSYRYDLPRGQGLQSHRKNFLEGHRVLSLQCPGSRPVGRCIRAVSPARRPILADDVLHRVNVRNHQCGIPHQRTGINPVAVSDRSQGKC
ncbi:hypothetical protein C1X65_26225 [Pseudomonas sp. FW305-70]|nr:hypothetical protein C1X65_26225 [Pseudomonas sp. FW305-70]